MIARIREGLIAGGVAAVLSGAPSTLHALATGRDPLAATRAAGSMALPRGSGAHKVVAAIPVHVALSLGWGVALSVVLPRRHGAVWGLLAGAAIAAVDLGVVAPRSFPEIAALPQVPQVLDHLAFGALVGWVLERLAAGRPAV